MDWNPLNDGKRDELIEEKYNNKYGCENRTLPVCLI